MANFRTSKSKTPVKKHPNEPKLNSSANVTPKNKRSIQLTLRQPGSNPEGLGATVRVEWSANGKQIRSHRIVKRQSSFQCSSDPRIHIGVGELKSGAGKAIVTWPDLTQEQFTLRAGA